MWIFISPQFWRPFFGAEILLIISEYLHDVEFGVIPKNFLNAANLLTSNTRLL
jgi:hypothetical protein